jgi:hypothetical protein
MGQTSDPETFVIHQKMTPGNNPEDFKQHYDHDGSLQLQLTVYYIVMGVKGDERMIWLVSHRCGSDVHRAGPQCTGWDVCGTD